MSHLELPNTENVSFNEGKAQLFFAFVMFKCLQSVMTIFSFVTILLINITGPEHAEQPSFNMPR